MTIFSHFHLFRDLRISLSFKGKISFLKPSLTSSCFSILLLFGCCTCVLLIPLPSHAFWPSLALSQSRTQPSTHNSSIHSLAHAIRQPDSWPRPPGGEDGALLGAFCWRRWIWLLSTESSHSYTMGPFTHMSDSVADSGRGTSRVAPSLVGGPENCGGSWFISVQN